MTYVIEKNVPITKTIESKFPFAQMEVGDSFFVPSKEAANLRSAATRHSRQLGFTFTTKKCDGGVRIWRTA